MSSQALATLWPGLPYFERYFLVLFSLTPVAADHRHGGQTRSRQGPIPQGRPIDKELLLDLAKNLLNQIVLEGKVWPCKHWCGWRYACWQKPMLLFYTTPCGPQPCPDETELTI